MRLLKLPKFGTELENLPIQFDGQKYYVESHGPVSAGFPSPADDFLAKKISIDERYLSKIESTYINKVGGLSMLPDYELNDLLIIRSDYEPIDGDDVVVSIDNSEFMLKRLYKKENRLVALNEKFAKAVEMREGVDVIVLGVVDAIIRDKGRKYR